MKNNIEEQLIDSQRRAIKAKFENETSVHNNKINLKNNKKCNCNCTSVYKKMWKYLEDYLEKMTNICPEDEYERIFYEGHQDILSYMKRLKFDYKVK